MAPIPIFTKSPINAAKAEGVTPKTVDVPGSRGAPNRPDAATTTAPPPTNTAQYPAPQPGARPSPPNPTPTTTHIATAYSQYTPATATAGFAPGAGMSPPPPQPGAVPTPPSRTAIPPPPRAGESISPCASKGVDANAIPNPTTMPPQASIPPPAAPYRPRGTAVATGPAGPGPTSLYEGSPGADLSNPSQGYQQGGYQQQGFTPAGPLGYQQQQQPQQQSLGSDWGQGSQLENEEEGVWGIAKKWAQTAGNNIAAAESEVWRRINKG
ncbi:uncharacterized protein DNG_01397 [Cephalotrichum gorgonifer]|uniref:Uncharacterized protein n=1 Tax=Cephalotrichum gorgonifer TaxID=2041049 RepID=A0AAE8MRJ7_9PEZI|nr:uncharacterized protein DNG_01397 [Cephalotrichum gorgonifer]